MARTVTLVRYVSPFGSPATMQLDAASFHLERDLALWDELEEIGLLDERSLRIGRPRLDDAVFHLSDLPEWIWTSDAGWLDLVRRLVPKAESLARDHGCRYVVVMRSTAGSGDVFRPWRLAVMKRSLVIEGDEVRWETR